MSDIAELVKRLRECAAELIVMDAADAIERLQAEIAKLRLENAKLRAVAEARCRHLPDALATLETKP